MKDRNQQQGLISPYHGQQPTVSCLACMPPVKNHSMVYYGMLVVLTGIVILHERLPQLSCQSAPVYDYHGSMLQ